LLPSGEGGIPFFPATIGAPKDFTVGKVKADIPRSL
jgi:hypothetical protein